MARSKELAVLQFMDDYYAFAFREGDVTLRAAGLTRRDLLCVYADDEVKQCCNLRAEALLSTPWRITGKNADYVVMQIKPWIDGLLRGSLEAEYFGNCVFENVFRADNTLLKSQKKPFYWFYINPNQELFYKGDTYYFESQSATLGVKVDTETAFSFVVNDGSYETPNGDALFSRVYWPVFFRGKSWKFWMLFLERFATPFLVGKAINTDIMAEKLALAFQDASIAISSSESIDSLEAEQSGDSFVKIEQAIIRRIQKLVIGRVLTADLDIGSRAAQEVEERLSDSKYYADLIRAESLIQKVCDAVCAKAGIEKVDFSLGQFTDISADRAKRDKDLVDAGILQFTRSYLEREYHLRPEDFVIASEVVPAKTVKPMSLAAKPEEIELTPGQQRIENGTQSAAKMAGQPFRDGDLLAIIAAATDEQDLYTRLNEFYLGKESPFEERFRSVAEDAIVGAGILGYSDSESFEI